MRKTDTETRSRTTRAERRKARTTAAILEAGEALFLKRGFREVTVAEIAERADVAVGSIYQHFGSKLGLFVRVVDRGLDFDRHLMEEALDTGTTPIAQMVAVGEAHLRLLRDQPGYFRILELPHVDIQSGVEMPAVADRMSAHLETAVEQFAGLIRRGIETGQLRPMDPYLATMFLWGAWNGVIALSLRPDRLRLGPERLRAVLEEGRQILLEGMAGPASRETGGAVKDDVVREIESVPRVATEGR